jgi:hypothetical protein
VEGGLGALGSVLVLVWERGSGVGRAVQGVLTMSVTLVVVVVVGLGAFGVVGSAFAGGSV